MVRTRFAPSPTGSIHIGSVYGVLLDYAYARAKKGTFVLRIEDTDQKRYVKEAEDYLYRGLAWVGMEPDEGPKKGGSFAPYRQSERLEIYKKYALKLIEQGDAYYCFCTPERLEKVRVECRGKNCPPMYDKKCRNLSKKEAEERVAKGEKAVVRMKIPDNQVVSAKDLIRGEIEFESKHLDDQVILKSDGFPTYHLAAVVDDHLMEITHVVRGHEWLPSFPKHVLLYQYLGWKMPRILHTPVILDPEGGKLSKRHGHASLAWYQEQGFLPEAIINYLCLLGWSHPQEKDIFDLKEFIKVFDLKDVSPVSPTFDLAKLEWVNGMYLRSKTDKELVELLVPFLPKMKKEQVEIATPLIKERIKRLSEAEDLLEFVWCCPNYDKKVMLKDRLRAEQAREMLTLAQEIIEKEGIDDHLKLQEKLMAMIKKEGRKVGDFFMVFRIAVCAKPITPPILESLPLIGKKETLARIEAAIKKVS